MIQIEIERKFLINTFPDLPIEQELEVYQYYLITDPIEVRLRKINSDNLTNYKMTFKSKGKLSRQEYEINISEIVYNDLLSFINKTPIHKIIKKYKLNNGLILECNLVDNEFMYAEIEFKNENLANQFNIKSIPILLKDITYNDFYKMKNYWKRKQ